MEFSKKILYWLFGISILIIIYVFAVQILIIFKDFQGSTELVNALIIALTPLLSIAVGSYYFKARAENLLKLKQMYGEDKVNEVVEEIENERNGY